MCNKTTCGSLSLYPPIHLCVLSFTDLFARKLQLPWAAGQGLFDSVQCTVSFKLRNRNLTLALIFQKCQLKNFKSKSAKKTRKYFKIVTFANGTTATWHVLPLSSCPPILLSTAFVCICCGYAKDAKSLFGISNEPQWLLPSHCSLPPASPPPPQMTQKAASKARPICRLRYLSSDFRFCIGFNSTAPK